MNKFLKSVILILTAVSICVMLPFKPAKAAQPKKTGILIGANDGTFTWVDLNDTTQKSSLMTTSKGYLMLPAYKMASLMKEITYSYNAKTQKATITNTYNHRKLVFTRNSSKALYYKNASSKPVTITMKCPMIIPSGKCVMISADVFKYVMNTSTGYRYVSSSAMKGLGYDTTEYGKILIYSPAAKIREVKKATQVKGLKNTIRVTIPEGYSCAQIFTLLVNKGVCASVDELFDACQNYPYDQRKYPLIAALPANDNRCFRLEGYLFPDTYEFYRLSKPQDAIGKMLLQTHNKITEQIKQQAKKKGLTVNELLILASIVEKETGDKEEMKNVAKVFLNRLAVPMKLQSVAPNLYVEQYIKPYIKGDKDRYNAYYNTFKCEALPAGPICNPGMNAINAVLAPNDITSLFFFSDKNGKYYYSDTFEEQQLKIEELNIN